jgi:translation initiation factor IF-3
VNREIRVREVRVIGPEGEQLGILPTPEAFKQAQEGGPSEPATPKVDPG